MSGEVGGDWLDMQGGGLAEAIGAGSDGLFPDAILAPLATLAIDLVTTS